VVLAHSVAVIIKWRGGQHLVSEPPRNLTQVSNSIIAARIGDAERPITGAMELLRCT
jgi:hypothetical protein